MAQAHPKSRFFGYDSHAGSIELARRRAAEGPHYRGYVSTAIGGKDIEKSP